MDLLPAQVARGDAGWMDARRRGKQCDHRIDRRTRLRQEHLDSHGVAATGNNVQFLSDPTGNRRWLPFEVESILSPREHPFDYPHIYAQALHLLRSGFRYWFTQQEIIELNLHNHKFEAPRLERELVALYFAHPTEEQHGIFMTASRALQIIGAGISQKLSAVYVGRAFCELGFRKVRVNHCWGYLVIERDGDMIKAQQVHLAMEAEGDYSQQDTDPDLPF